MAGIIEAILSGFGGYAAGEKERDIRETDERARADERREARMLSLLGREGFEFEPEGAPATEAPPSPTRMQVGSLELGDVSGGVSYDPRETRDAREQRRQRQAWDELPREEYPQFLEGYDYLRELPEYKSRQREKKDVEERRTVVAKALGLDAHHPDVEAIVRANMDPETYRRRRETAPEEERARTRAGFEREDRAREQSTREAQGVANQLVSAGRSDSEVIMALRREGFATRLTDGEILGIIASARKNYGGGY